MPSFSFLRGSPFHVHAVITHSSRWKAPKFLSIYSELTPRHITRVDADVVKEAKKLADRAFTTWSVMRTKFLSPLGVQAVLNEINSMTEMSAVPFGGYPYAERCRILMMREELFQTHQHDLQNISDVVPVQVSGNFLMVKAKHSDFLGAFSGIGLKSEDLGDIIVEKDTGCLTFASPEVVRILEKRLEAVRSVSVRANRIAYEKMVMPPARVKEIRTVEASMRLDAVASAAFGIPRDKMAMKIGSGEIQLNWDTVKKPTALVKQGDTISCKAKGRAKIETVTMTQKMKYAVHLVRYT